MCGTYVYVSSNASAKSCAAICSVRVEQARGELAEGLDRRRQVGLGRVLLAAWLIPSREGAKIIAAGSTRAISAAS